MATTTLVTPDVISAAWAGDLAEALYTETYGADHKEFRNAKLAEMEDWIRAGDWKAGEAIDLSALAREWFDYDAEAE